MSLLEPGMPPRNVVETTDVIEPGHTYASVTDKISAIVLARPTTLGWLAGFFISSTLLVIFIGVAAYLIAKGVGIWGVNVPIAWGFAITNFVWWIGIGHAGTFISAFLLLMRQDWRTSINRFAEAMTLFAVSCAGLFPLLHLGRPWYFYWLIPYPNTMSLWPQFRSALVWDVFAVGTYFTISLVFWYVGLVPDLATLRDRAQSRIAKVAYGIFALGWRGSAMHWHRYKMAYLLLGGLATPLVISVHSVVSMDFAEAQVPGWHSTIFPPYFVAGAIFSGFAMVLTLAIILRAVYGLHGLITLKHLDKCAKLTLVTGMVVAYAYMFEAFIAWYSGDLYEQYAINRNRPFGPYGLGFWIMVLCNVLVPQLLWFKRVRLNVPALFVISILVNIGMWMERFVIVVQSLHRDFMLSAWGMYYPTVYDWAIFIGTLGLFACFFFIFVRILPAISIAEVRELVKEKAHERGQNPDTPAGREA